MERETARTLLVDQHTFPGTYTFRVIVPPERRGAVLDAVHGALSPGCSVLDVGERPSRAGRWVGLHVQVHVEAADHVLDIYGAVQGVEGVAMTL
ncbi:MAG: DUF493 domain-containing protein [Alphaproteobacteria bacterium]|nr:DUF493 domain-containing protein [Alphaproteobacteria bacterium]